MPVTAKERAEKALATKQAQVEKAHAKYTKLAEKRDAAEEAAEKQLAELRDLAAERDHIQTHPALRQEGDEVTPAPGEVQPGDISAGEGDVVPQADPLAFNQ